MGVCRGLQPGARGGWGASARHLLAVVPTAPWWARPVFHVQDHPGQPRTGVVTVCSESQVRRAEAYPWCRLLLARRLVEKRDAALPLTGFGVTWKVPLEGCRLWADPAFLPMGVPG